VEHGPKINEIPLFSIWGEKMFDKKILIPHTTDASEFQRILDTYRVNYTKKYTPKGYLFTIHGQDENI